MIVCHPLELHAALRRARWDRRLAGAPVRLGAGQWWCVGIASPFRPGGAQRPVEQRGGQPRARARRRGRRGGRRVVRDASGMPTKDTRRVLVRAPQRRAQTKRAGEQGSTNGQRPAGAARPPTRQRPGFSHVQGEPRKPAAEAGARNADTTGGNKVLPPRSPDTGNEPVSAAAGKGSRSPPGRESWGRTAAPRRRPRAPVARAAQAKRRRPKLLPGQADLRCLSWNSQGLQESLGYKLCFRSGYDVIMLRGLKHK
jgi:hypothetical protein